MKTMTEESKPLQDGEFQSLSPRQIRPQSSKPEVVFVWILILCAMVLMMVVIGGVTRLTGSGLSIVEWKPLMGAIPPLTRADWMEVFSQYQNSPQGQLVNRGMTLPQFQWIFFWEYFHRLLGRLMGVTFLIPWLFFWARGYYNRRWAGQLLFGFLLGGLQGLMGWLMVASGLVDQPQVSHYRLAAHLMLAFFILAYFWRLAWVYRRESILESPALVSTPLVSGALVSRSLVSGPDREKTGSLRRSLNIFFGVLVLQIFYGALVAGLRAGFMYNTFPDMEGQFFPQGAWFLQPLWRNLFDNPLFVQWIHRSLGWTLFFGALYLWGGYRKQISASLRKGLGGVLWVVLVQFSLGVATLIMKVPMSLAVIHQVGAAVLLMNLLWLRWEVSEGFDTDAHPPKTV